LNRIATVTGFKGDGQVNWVLKRWTQYVDVSNNVIWTTDRSALLGVANGAAAGMLTNPCYPTDDGWGAWTGMHPDYTTGENCARWTSALSTDFGRSVNVAATNVGATFPDNGSLSNCAQLRHLLCVEP
jgi:hypothetical protein